MKNEMKWIVFILKCIITYGPKLWKIGRELYDNIEKWSSDKKGEEKAKMFDRAAKVNFRTVNKVDPTDLTVKEFREDVWKSKNWNKIKKVRGTYEDVYV